MNQTKDEVVRAITDDGSFRVITASTSETVAGAIRSQSAEGDLARHFADLLTGTILVRETMAPRLRVQGIVKGAGGRGALVADSNPDGTARGLVQMKEPGSSFRFGGGSLLQVMRTMPSGGIHQGIVDVSAAGGLNEALMTYMQESEQIVSVIAVGTVMEGGAVRRAGGYIVQLLPEAARPMQMIMTERLRELPHVEKLLAAPEFSPQSLMDELLYGMPFAVLDKSPLRYECRCSLERVMTSLATLGPGDISELVGSGEMLDVSCDYCGKQYAVAPEHLRALLDAS